MKRQLLIISNVLPMDFPHVAHKSYLHCPVVSHEFLLYFHCISVSGEFINELQI